VTLGAGTETATVLFTDLVGSTVLRQTLGDDGADELRRQHDRMVREAVSAHGGTEVKGTGDGFMCVFPASAEGVTAAVAMQQAFARFNRRAPAPLGLRVGLSAGDVVWEAGDCFGTPVVEARRLCDAADTGQVLVSEVVRLLAGSRGGHRFNALPPLALKGLTDPVSAFEVAWLADAAGAELPLPPTLAGTETVAFVGRDDERERLTTAWKEALAGTRQVVLVSGEPGVGKTRLVAETARQAHAAGATVLFGRCDEDMGVPYQPFVEALDGYLAVARLDDVRDHAGRTGAELARLLPRLADLVPGLPEPVKADPETERYQQFEAVRAFLASLASVGPVVLVLDDLHWAAQPTLLLLRHLLRGDAATALLVLGTYRDTDLSRSHSLAGFLADLRRAGNAERVDLRGLPADEVLELIRAAAGQPLDADLADLAQDVWAETEGNPFFVGQVLRHLVETRAVVQDAEGRWVPGPNAGHVGLPEGVREVIGRRLSILSDETNALLATAAVIGREFDAALLVEATDADTEAVFDALEQAEEARLLVAVAGRPGRYGFAHALVRSTLYDELATTRRLRLHRRVGLALEARDAGQVDELARHWSEAAALGDTDRAVDYCGRAAEQAMTRLAYEEAAGWYDRALAVLDPDHSDHAVRAELLIGLGTAQWFAGAFVASRESFDKAIEAARASGDADLFARAAVGRGGRRAWTDAGLVDETLMAALEEALEQLPAEDSVLRARVNGRLASELYFAFGGIAPERRAELSAAALAMARRIGDLETLGYALSTFHWGSWVPGNAKDRLAVATELLEVARQAGNLELETIAWQQRMIDQWELGDIDGVRASAERERELFGALRIAEGNWIITVFDCTLALFEGRIDDAERLMNEALAHAERMESPTALQFYGVQQMAIRRMRGGMEDMVPLTRAMVEEYPAIPAWRTGLAYAMVESGDRDGAAEQLRILATHDFTDLPSDANWHVGVALCAVVAEVVGDAASGALLFDLLEPYSEAWVCAGMPADCLGPGHRFTGLAAAAAGRLDDAERHLTLAVERSRAAGAPPLTAGAEADLARVLRQQGHDDRARTLVEDCIAICDELAMPAIRAKAEQVFAR
jgi:class 3 adenylate cyclase/tetratricopeptide (TPR) repeat protein